MYRTGHSLIKAKMKEEHAELAGEMSGHMFFADRYRGYDDALYSACRLIEIVAKSGRPLSAQLAGLPKMVSTPEIRVDCPDEVKFDLVQRVAKHFQKDSPHGRHRRCSRQLPEGWGPATRLQYATRAGNAFQSHQRTLAEAISIGDGAGVRRSQDI